MPKETFKDLPFDSIRRVLISFRKRYFTNDTDITYGLLADMSHEDLYDTLTRRHHFHDVKKYSYNYKLQPDGLREVNNISRPEGYEDMADKDNDLEDEYQMELHPRTFDIPEQFYEKYDDTSEYQIFVPTHYEISRFQHWGEHVRNKHVDWSGGRDMMKEVLESEDIEVRKVS